jgi:hypothetical protein
LGRNISQKTTRVVRYVTWNKVCTLTIKG